MSDLHIQYIPLAQLQVATRNPKRHDLGEFLGSFKRFGYVEPIVVDGRTGKMVAGHGRRETLIELLKSGQSAPNGVRVQGDIWYAPVVTGWSSSDDAEAEAYSLASNRIGELGGWEKPELLDLLREIELPGTGFVTDDIDLLINEIEEPTPPVGDPDDVPDEPEEAAVYVKSGDLYLLGDHRILCGDATNPKDVARVLAGEKPHLLVTDPPYGVSYDPEWRNEAKGGDSARVGKVTNDDRSDWREAWKLFPGDVAYVWHGGLHASSVQDSLEAVGFDIRSQIIWAKDRFALSRGDYHWKHEGCLYSVRAGGKSHWQGDRTQTTVWEIPARETTGENAATIHSTQKPVECMRRPIVNNSEKGDLIYEPFCGSGTTIIAAETTGRACAAIELEPRYVQLTLERFEAFTGKKATKVAA